MSARYCQALDLVNDPALIAEYEAIHQRIWPEVARHIRACGIVNMQIWRLGTRLFMIMDVDDGFSFERAAQLDAGNPTIAEWEAQMWKFQLPTPWTPAGEKWVLMTQLFSLTAQP